MALPTSAKKDMLYPVSVCLSVCYQLHIKNYWSELHANFTRDVSSDKEVAKILNSGSHPDLDPYLGILNEFLPLCMGYRIQNIFFSEYIFLIIPEVDKFSWNFLEG